MKLLISLIFLLLASPCFAINYFWCEKTENCVKAYGGCGRYFSVHGRYKELYEAKAHEGDKVANCLKPTEIDRQYKFEGQPVCENKRCHLTLKKEKK